MLRARERGKFEDAAAASLMKTVAVSSDVAGSVGALLVRILRTTRRVIQRSRQADTEVGEAGDELPRKAAAAAESAPSRPRNEPGSADTGQGGCQRHRSGEI